MGQNKALLKVNDQPILQRVISAVAELSPDQYLVTNTPEAYQQFQLPVVKDAIPGKGALGGVYTALLQAQYDWVFVLACDMPFLDPGIITQLASSISPAYDVVCLQHNGQLEPLHTFYHKSCLPIIEKQLSLNKLKITRFFEAVNPCLIDTASLFQKETENNFLMNLNTRQDLAKARLLAGE